MFTRLALSRQMPGSQVERDYESAARSLREGMKEELSPTFNAIQAGYGWRLGRRIRDQDQRDRLGGPRRSVDAQFESG
jgi:hypothetical protein